ncbi:MAG: hypothetical protein JO289_02990 [Xanthobacteraceae bacterium]|nr:hypothetical protein [Xanthobacteraceae bacterium]
MNARRITTYQLDHDSLTTTNPRRDARQYSGPRRELILWFLLAALLFMLLADAAYAANRGSSTHTRSVDAGVPTYNIDAICRGAASIAHVLETTAPDNAQNCRQDERGARQQLLQQWTQFDAADRVMCDGAAQSGTVEPTYTELMTCLEVARDNRDKTTHVAQRPDQSHQPTAGGASPAQGAAPIRNALAGR